MPTAEHVSVSHVHEDQVNISAFPFSSTIKLQLICPFLFACNVLSNRLDRLKSIHLFITAAVNSGGNFRRLLDWSMQFLSLFELRLWNTRS